jgi:hypothetical protein
MEAYGFTEQEILDAIEAAGYANGGRVGYAFGDLVRGSSMVQPVPKIKQTCRIRRRILLS